MSKTLTQAQILELRKTVEHCLPIRGFPFDYVRHFAEPKDGKCLACGSQYWFVWGLAHGHGHCAHCAWPATAYHFFDDGDELGVCHRREVVILQAHPDDVEVRSKGNKNG